MSEVEKEMQEVKNSSFVGRMFAIATTETSLGLVKQEGIQVPTPDDTDAQTIKVETHDSSSITSRKEEGKQMQTVPVANRKSIVSTLVQRDALIEETLGCSRCNKPCLSPVYTCQKSHLTCGICFEKGKDGCFVCGLPMGTNSFVEMLTRKWGVVVECPNVESGCNVLPMSADKLKEHATTCEYRPITCYFKGDEHFHEECNELWNMDMKSFEIHWNKHHQQEFLPHFQTNAIMTFCTQERTLEELFSTQGGNIGGSSLSLKEPTHYRPTYFKFDGKIFQFQVNIKNAALYWWMLVLGGEKEALQYSAKSKLFVPRNNLKTREGEFLPIMETAVHKTPVLPYHRYLDFDENCYHYGFAPASQVKALLQETPATESSPASFEFSLCVLLLKNGNGGGSETIAAEAGTKTNTRNDLEQEDESFTISVPISIAKDGDTHGLCKPFTIRMDKLGSLENVQNGVESLDKKPEEITQELSSRKRRRIKSKRFSELE